MSAGGRALLKGRTGENPVTIETEGQMIQRVMPDLMGLKNIMVLNDEAHHCYREKPAEDDDADLKGDDKKEAEKNFGGMNFLKNMIQVKKMIYPYFIQ
jgi:type III restriction enzyme